MVATALALAILSVLLADPIPRWLSSAHWTSRDPIGGLVLWQAVGLAAGLSLCGCFLVLGLRHLGPSLPEALIALGGDSLDGRPFRQITPFDGLFLFVAAAVALRLFWTLARSVLRVVRLRRVQRDALDVLATPWPDDPGVLVLDHPSAVAYCLPGNKSRLVISTGAAENLGDEELAAVLTHEKAHLRNRHDLVVLPFVAWGSAFPFVVGVRRAQTDVALLVEMMADDVARKSVQADALIGALQRVRPASAKNLAGLNYDIASDVREARLRTPAQGTSRLRFLSIVAGILLFGVPTVILIGPAFL